MKIDLIGGTSEQKYKSLNSQRTINWYLVPSTNAEASKSQKALFPFPGLVQFAAPTGRYHRGAFVTQGVGIADRCFFVLDQTLYELGFDSTVTSRGSVSAIPAGFTKVLFAINGNNQMFIGNTTAAYNLDLSTNTLTAISDVDYPGVAIAPVTSVDYSDGILIVSAGGRVYFSHTANDNTNWVGTDVFTPIFKADSVMAVACVKSEVYAFGSQTIEVYLNDSTTPYSRRPGSTVLYGLAAVDSLCTFNDGFLFLGKTQDGQYNVYFMSYYYTVSQISNFSINWQQNNTASTIENAYAFIQYSKDGHIFYHLTIPGTNTTYVYDILTKEWQERQSKRPYPDSDGADVYGEFRCKYHVNFRGKNLFFDSYSGKIFQESFTTMTEDGLTIKRQRTSQIYDQDRVYTSASMLEIDCNTGEAALNTGQGSDPVLMLEISKDGGRTFGQPRNISLGKLGKYLSRCRTTKLGTMRSACLRLTLTDPVDLMIQSAVVRGTLSTD